MRFPIQVISDIHLEFYKSFPRIPPAPDTDILILAGDIGTLEKENLLTRFFGYCSANWKHVLYVPGNHELYHSRKTHGDIIERLREITSSFPNVHLLVNNKVTIDVTTMDSSKMSFPVQFIGTPLFPHITGEMSELMADFTRIHSKDERGWTTPITPKQWNIELHEPQYNWLMSSLREHTESHPVVVITHYPPIREGTSHPRFSDEPDEMKQYFSGDLETEFTAVLPEYSVVISGHTHYCYDFVREKNIRFISRAMGYPDEIRETGFMENGSDRLEIVLTKTVTTSE